MPATLRIGWNPVEEFVDLGDESLIIGRKEDTELFLDEGEAVVGGRRARWSQDGLLCLLQLVHKGGRGDGIGGDVKGRSERAISLDRREEVSDLVDDLFADAGRSDQHDIEIWISKGLPGEDVDATLKRGADEIEARPEPEYGRALAGSGRRCVVKPEIEKIWPLPIWLHAWGEASCGEAVSKIAGTGLSG